MTKSAQHWRGAKSRHFAPNAYSDWTSTWRMRNRYNLFGKGIIASSLYRDCTYICGMRNRYNLFGKGIFPSSFLQGLNFHMAQTRSQAFASPPTPPDQIIYYLPGLIRDSGRLYRGVASA